MGRETDSSDSEPVLQAACLATKRHACHYENCEATFSRPNRLRAHLDQHLGKKHFKCKVKGCGKSYTSNAHLKRHTSISHEERTYVPVFTCQEPGCLRELSNESNLRRHHEQVHKKPFVCKTCGAGFNKHRKLSTHLATHTGVYPFKCDKCGVSCATNYELTRHNRGHKTHTCSWSDCGLTFDTWTLLRKHYKLEHPPRYECSNCSKVFTKKSNLKNHLEVHMHPFDREVLQCPYDNCPRFYFQRTNLLVHIKSSHEGKKFACDFPGCNRILCTKKKLEYHKKLHDPGVRLPRRRCNSRKKRKDAGQPKRSIAAKLSGASVPYSMEKLALSCGGVLEGQLAREQPEDMLVDSERTTAPHYRADEPGTSKNSLLTLGAVDVHGDAGSSVPAPAGTSVNRSGDPPDLDGNDGGEEAASDASQTIFPKPHGWPSASEEREMSGTSLPTQTASDETSLDHGKGHEDVTSSSMIKAAKQTPRESVARVTVVRLAVQTPQVGQLDTCSSDGTDENIPLASNEGPVSRVGCLEMPLAELRQIKNKKCAVETCSSQNNGKLCGVQKERDTSDENSVITNDRSSACASSDDVNSIANEDVNFGMSASDLTVSSELAVCCSLAAESGGVATGQDCDVERNRQKSSCSSSSRDGSGACTASWDVLTASNVVEGSHASCAHRGRYIVLNGTSEQQPAASGRQAQMMYPVFNIHQWLSAMLVAMRLTIPQTKDPV